MNPTPASPLPPHSHLPLSEDRDFPDYQIESDTAFLEVRVREQTKIVNSLGREVIDTAERLTSLIEDDGYSGFDEVMVRLSVYLGDLRRVVNGYRTAERSLKWSLERQRQTPVKTRAQGGQEPRNDCSGSWDHEHD